MKGALLLSRICSLEMDLQAAEAWLKHSEDLEPLALGSVEGLTTQGHFWVSRNGPGDLAKARDTMEVAASASPLVDLLPFAK